MAKKSPTEMVGPYASPLQGRLQGAGSAAIVPGAHPEREVVKPFGNPITQLRDLYGKLRGKKKSPSHVSGD